MIDLFEHKAAILVKKGRNSIHHLECEDSQRPPVERLIMTFTGQHLWREIRSRATKTVCLPNRGVNLLRKPKIRQDNIAVFTEKHVLRLEIAVDEVTAVKVPKRHGDLCDDENSCLLVKAPLF